jgi:poly(3-hydroxybutyrate) depolymerase
LFHFIEKNTMNKFLFTLVTFAVTTFVSAGVANIKDGWYFIKNSSSGKYLQVSNENSRAASNIEIGSSRKSDGQKWKLTNVGDGYVTLTSALGNFNVDVANGEDKNGANIQIYDAYGGNAQQFIIMTTSFSNVYTIGTKVSNGEKALDVENGSKSDGANVIQWKNESKDNQSWIFENASGDSATSECWAKALGYECCSSCQPSAFKDESGEWGIENNQWCGIISNGNCCALGYECCKTTTTVIYTDESGKWGIENNEWCEIKDKPQQQQPQQGQGQQQQQPKQDENNNEQTYSFGDGLKNKPVPSKGCGKNSSLPKTGSFDFQWSGGKRTVRIDVPDNYNNNNPYRLIFGMHCMGGWAGGVQQEGYYGLKPLDTGKTSIFVAPEGNGNQAPWGQGDYQLFDQLLDKLKNEFCIDESRVFSTGFSYGSMFSNGLSWNHQKVLRGVAVYETAERNIWLPKHTGEPIAWMGVLGLDDGLCTPEMGRHARDIILEHNSEGGKAVNEKAEEAPRNSPHKCYDYKTVDPRFPVRWCTQSGGHIWDHKDPGSNKSWVPETTWNFITQF